MKHKGGDLRGTQRRYESTATTQTTQEVVLSVGVGREDCVSQREVESGSGEHVGWETEASRRPLKFATEPLEVEGPGNSWNRLEVRATPLR